MERAVTILDEARAAVSDDAPVPCDEEGVPSG
jgi:hypothetical protein